MVRSRDLRVRPALRSDREFLFEVRRTALRTHVEQTSGWDDAEQRATADKEFGGLPYCYALTCALALLRSSATPHSATTRSATSLLVRREDETDRRRTLTDEQRRVLVDTLATFEQEPNRE